MILKYYSENIRVPDFSPYEEKEIIKVLVAADLLVFSGDAICSDGNHFRYQKDGLILTATSSEGITEYRIGLVAEDDPRPVEVFCAILSDRSSGDPIYTIMRHNSDSWVSELWSIAMKEDAATEILERFSRI